jgi:putative ABC transport system permease protein
LTVLGVAIGVGVVIAVQLANGRAIGSFENGLEILSGRADLSIEANGRALDETLIGELDWVWDVGAMTAIIEGRIERTDSTSGSGFGGETVPLFGVDLLSDAPFRTYAIEPDRPGSSENLALEVTRSEFIDLLTDPEAIIVPRALARKWAVDTGDTVDLLAGNRRRPFRVAVILEDEGIARAFNGQIVFMDIAAAQMALDRFGEIDRIEIALDPRSDGRELSGPTEPSAATVAERIRIQLPDSILVDEPENNRQDAERMTRAFRYNLAALSYIALVVGMILIYNTMNIAVVRRRGEIGALRTLGASRAQIGGMFAAEAVALGVLGAIGGVALGEAMARASGALVSRTIAALYTGAAGDGSGGMDPGLYAVMILLGGVMAGISGAGPAIRATTIAPVDTMRKGFRAELRPRVWTIAGAICLVPAILLSFAPPVGEFPFLGYGAGILFIASFALFSPLLIQLITRYLGWVPCRLFPAEGRLAMETIRGRLSHVLVAVVSLSIAVAMLSSVAIMVASFRDTVVVWVDQTLRGDLYLRPAASGGDGGRNTMAPETVAVLDMIPGIAAVDRFRAVVMEYDGFPTVLASGEFGTLAAHSRLLFMDERTTAAIAGELIGSDRVVVSEPFASRHGVHRGDTIALPMPDGDARFEVAAIFYDYSNEGGLVVMDRGTWIEQTGDSAVSNVAVYLEPGVDARTVQQAIAERLGDTQARVTTNGELRAQVFRVFDQTFQVTYALEVIALAVALLGIATTLAALVLERRPEIAMLRFVGASHGQIRRMIMIESGLVGVLGSVIGVALGAVLSLLLVYVINFQSFGWTIQFALPMGFLVQSFLVVVAATSIAGLYPANVALKMDPIEGIRAE